MDRGLPGIFIFGNAQDRQPEPKAGDHAQFPGLTKGGKQRELMANLETIFDYERKLLEIDKETNELYWNKKKLVTEQKLTISGWINAAIIVGGFSTGLMLIIKLLEPWL